MGFPSTRRMWIARPRKLSSFNANGATIGYMAPPRSRGFHSASFVVPTGLTPYSGIKRPTDSFQ